MGPILMVAADRNCFPVAAHATSVSSGEVKLVRTALEEPFVTEPPQLAVDEKAKNSTRLAEGLPEKTLELTAPNRVKRGQPTQHGQPLRHYQQRGKIARLLVWPQNSSRQIVTRYERHQADFFGFLHLSWILRLLIGHS